MSEKVKKIPDLRVFLFLFIILYYMVLSISSRGFISLSRISKATNVSVSVSPSKYNSDRFLLSSSSFFFSSPFSPLGSFPASPFYPSLSNFYDPLKVVWVICVCVCYCVCFLGLFQVLDPIITIFVF